MEKSDVCQMFQVRIPRGLREPCINIGWWNHRICDRVPIPCHSFQHTDPCLSIFYIIFSLRRQGPQGWRSDRWWWMLAVWPVARQHLADLAIASATCANDRHDRNQGMWLPVGLLQRAWSISSWRPQTVGLIVFFAQCPRQFLRCFLSFRTCVLSNMCTRDIYI